MDFKAIYLILLGASISLGDDDNNNNNNNNNDDNNNNNERINEGASTSGQLTLWDEWELENYARTVSHLMLSEDRSEGDLTDMMNHRFQEIEAFHDELFYQVMLVEFGSVAHTNVARRRNRVSFFLHRLRSIILEIIDITCSHHFINELWYEYDSEKNLIVVKQNNSFPLDDCLCANHAEREILNAPLSLPLNSAPELTLQISNHDQEVLVMNARQYHIIPISLISRFFNLWLSNEPSENLAVYFNSCVVTLFGRIRRSLLKVLLYQSRNTRIFSNEDRDNLAIQLENGHISEFISSSLGRAYGWLRGNIFLGPPDRGPFNPEYHRRNEQLLQAFEYGSLPIIGHIRFQDLWHLFNQLLNFVLESPSIFPFDRLLHGFNIYIGLILTLGQYDMVPLSNDQWEEREPTDTELRILGLEESIAQLRHQKFWAIKPWHRRDPRSVPKKRTKKKKPRKIVSADRELTHQWSKFIAELRKISIISQTRNETLIWTCNFTRLYKDYLQETFKTRNASLSFLSFDTFLYVKLESSSDWNRCNDPENPIAHVKWCRAWKLILDEMEGEDSLVINKNEKFDFKKLRSEYFLKNVEVLLSWLSTEIGSKPECEKTMNRTMQLSKHHLPSKLPKLHVKSVSSVDISLCFFSTLIISIFKNEHCYKNIRNK